MKNIDLTKETRSLSEVLSLARTESLLIHSASGEAFILEPADEFDREAAALGGSDKFMSFLETRSKESGGLSMREMRKKRSM